MLRHRAESPNGEKGSMPHLSTLRTYCADGPGQRPGRRPPSWDRLGRLRHGEPEVHCRSWHNYCVLAISHAVLSGDLQKRCRCARLGRVVRFWAEQQPPAEGPVDRTSSIAVAVLLFSCASQDSSTWFNNSAEHFFVMAADLLAPVVWASRQHGCIRVVLPHIWYSASVFRRRNSRLHRVENLIDQE